MFAIGIEKHHGLVYEGDGNYGRLLCPTPVVTAAKFVHLSDEAAEAHSSSDPFGYRFREDSFDPITRIRRGRFYFSDQNQPRPWIRCSNDPSFPLDGIESYGHAKGKSLETFYGNSIFHDHIRGKQKLPIVLLGVDDRFSAWTIINVEASVTGEDVVILKARSSLGILPLLDESKIPEMFLGKLNESLGTLADEVNRSAPASVIDRARDVAVHVLLAFYDLQKDDAQDLGKLVRRLESGGHIVACNAANIIARLHARAKPSEQAKRDLPPVREHDADLSVQCVGTLLCEVGFADWA